MSSTFFQALIVSMAVEQAEAASAEDAALSEALDRVSARHGEIAWPERVATAMAELEAAADRVARLVERVSDDASSLGALAAEISPATAGRKDQI